VADRVQSSSDSVRRYPSSERPRTSSESA
jgi:hypothetical protein